MKNNGNTQGELTWRWTLRIAGLCGFILSGVLLILRGEVPLVFLLISAGCMGLDSIQGFELRRKRNEDGWS